MPSTYRVIAMQAIVGGSCTFVLADSPTDHVTYASTSTVVLAALLGAFFVGASVQLETESTTNVIRRVDPFETGGGAGNTPGEYRVARVATARTVDGIDHLEVFLTRGTDPQQTAYNVFDPSLQQLLMAAFQHQTPGQALGLHVLFENSEIAAVSLGSSK